LPIATGKQQEQAMNRTLCLRGRPSLRLLALALPLGLSACANALTYQASPPASRQLAHDYDNTLTKSQQQAAISDLQSATAKKQGDAPTGNAATTTTTTTETKSGDGTN
jgi:uncharacterized membrane protein YgcG